MIMTITLEKIEEVNVMELRLPRICDSVIGNLTMESLILSMCDVVRQQVLGTSGILINDEDACDFIRICLDRFEQNHADPAAYFAWLLKMQEKYAEGSANG